MGRSRKAARLLLLIACVVSMAQRTYAQEPEAEENGAPTFTVSDLPVGLLAAPRGLWRHALYRSQ